MPKNGITGVTTVTQTHNTLKRLTFVRFKAMSPITANDTLKNKVSLWMLAKKRPKQKSP